MIKSLYKRLLTERQRNAIRAKLAEMRAPFYYGDRFYCPYCREGYRRFLPKGTVYVRENAVCPGCGSLERTRLLYYYLKQETPLFEGKPLRVLHFAPEKCLLDVLAKLDITYIDADINPNVARHVIDITAIEFPDDHFDLIICSHVLGHVPKEQKALKELNRVLATHGQLLILTWQGDNEETVLRRSPQTEYHHYAFDRDPTLMRLHGSDFASILRMSGFHVERIDYRNHFSKTMQSKYAFGDGTREIIFRATTQNT